MTPALAEIVDTFRSVDPSTRLELLLDYSKRLPPLPPRFHTARDAGINRVHECMTPVFLFVETDESGVVHINADVADEAPTVKGVLSLVVVGLDGATRADVASLPLDLVNQLGLGDLLRMNRAVGLTSMLARIKRDAGVPVDPLKPSCG